MPAAPFASILSLAQSMPAAPTWASSSAAR